MLDPGGPKIPRYIGHQLAHDFPVRLLLVTHCDRGERARESDSAYGAIGCCARAPDGASGFGGEQANGQLRGHRSPDVHPGDAELAARLYAGNLQMTYKHSGNVLSRPSAWASVAPSPLAARLLSEESAVSSSSSSMPDWLFNNASANL